MDFYEKIIKGIENNGAEDVVEQIAPKVRKIREPKPIPPHLRVAVPASVLLSSVTIVLGSLYILSTIVQVDGNGNSFANSLNPALTKTKIKNGTATNTEKYAYYMLPCSAEYIMEDPVQFASVLLPAIEGLTNPVYDEIIESLTKQIKGKIPSETSMNEKVENTLLDNIEKVQITTDMELPKI